MAPSGGGPSGGGGGGGGGGGSSVPIVSYTNSCAVITNLAVPNSFSFHVGNEQFNNAVDNYIGSNYTSVIVNGVTYVLSLNTPTSVNGTISMKLTNVSYLPILHTVTLQACQLSNSTSTGNTTLTSSLVNNTVNINISSVPFTLISISPSNVTDLVKISNATNLPATPNGLTVYSAIDVSILNATNSTQINITEEFQCSLDVAPYIFLNGTWSAIEPYTITNSSKCTITFTVPADPVVALMYQGQQISSNPLSVPSGSGLPNPVMVQPTIIATHPPLISQAKKDMLAAVLVFVSAMAFVLAYMGSKKIAKKHPGHRIKRRRKVKR